MLPAGPIMAAGRLPAAHRVIELGVVAATTAGIYLFLVVLLRVFGRRQLGQLTVVDILVVLLLGSAVETAMIHGDVSLAAGLVSAGTLLVLNRALTWALLRSGRFAHLVSGGPLLLVHDGTPVAQHLRRAGMTTEDLAEALRDRGYDSLDGVRDAILETDGSVSVIPRAASGGAGPATTSGS
jgi:uncharacterized membrane protein YcaP (DUF421 family)